MDATCGTSLTPETASVAQYLESLPTYRAVERITAAWEVTGLEEKVLAKELKALVASVSSRSKTVIDLEEVDWLFLAERYASMFSQV